MKKKNTSCVFIIILSIGLLMVYSSSHIWAQYKERQATSIILKRQAIL